MIVFTTSLKQFAEQGEKTGWTYIEIPAELAQQLKPGNKKSFRVKGKLDQFVIERIALLPMGGGNFIMPINAGMRKGIHKKKGAIIKVQLQVDDKPYELSKDLVDCLNDEPKARAFFQTLPKSHQNYFSKWIESAKTEETKARRIAQSLNALSQKQGYSEMLRALKKEKESWK